VTKEFRDNKHGEGESLWWAIRSIVKLSRRSPINVSVSDIP
jgi:hypothetical protein